MKGIFALLLSCATLVQAQLPTMTAGLANGRFWMAVDDPTRTGYLLGYTDLNLVFADVPVLPGGVPETSTDLSTADRERDWVPAHLNLGEVSKAITRFYTEPENIKMPIRYALRLVALRERGAAPADLERLAASYRRLFAEIK